MKFLCQRFEKLEPEQDRTEQTDTHTDATERITTPHSLLVTKLCARYGQRTEAVVG